MKTNANYAGGAAPPRATCGPIGLLRLRISGPGQVLWTEPLDLVTAHQVLRFNAEANPQFQAALAVNTRAMHAIVEGMFARARPERLGRLTQVNICSCSSFQSRPRALFEVRVVRIVTDAPAGLLPAEAVAALEAELVLPAAWSAGAGVSPDTAGGGEPPDEDADDDDGEDDDGEEEDEEGEAAHVPAWIDAVLRGCCWASNWLIALAVWPLLVLDQRARRLLGRAEG